MPVRRSSRANAAELRSEALSCYIQTHENVLDRGVQRWCHRHWDYHHGFGIEGAADPNPVSLARMWLTSCATSSASSSSRSTGDHHHLIHLVTGSHWSSSGKHQSALLDSPSPGSRFTSRQSCAAISGSESMLLSRLPAPFLFPAHLRRSLVIITEPEFKRLNKKMARKNLIAISSISRPSPLRSSTRRSPWS